MTTDCRAETLQLSQQFISHTSYAKLTSHGHFSGHGNSIHNKICLNIIIITILMSNVVIIIVTIPASRDIMFWEII